MLQRVSPLYEANAAFLADIINSCFNEYSFVGYEECALLRPFLKEAGLDHKDKSNYCPV